MGKSTISTGPFSIATFHYQRVKWNPDFAEISEVMGIATSIQIPVIFGSKSKTIQLILGTPNMIWGWTWIHTFYFGVNQG